VDRGEKELINRTVEMMRQWPDYWKKKVASIMYGDDLTAKTESATAFLYANIDKIPEQEIEKIVAKQERRFKVLAQIMKHRYEHVQALAEGKYKNNVALALLKIKEEKQVQELFASGMTAYEIMESGGPVTDAVLTRWIEEQESEAESNGVT